MPLDQVVPSRRRGVFEIGHEYLGAGVEGVDDHLAVHRAGDLGAAVAEIGRGRDDAPGKIGADGGGLGQKIREVAGVELALALDAAGEQFETAGVEFTEKPGEKLASSGRENLGSGGVNWPADFEAGDGGGAHGK